MFLNYTSRPIAPFSTLHADAYSPSLLNVCKTTNSLPPVKSSILQIHLNNAEKWKNLSPTTEMLPNNENSKQ